MAKRTFPTGGAIPMDPGSRDKLVTIQQLVESAGTSGFPVETWTTLRAAWMFREDQRGDEALTNGQQVGQSTVRWECDYAGDMDPELLDVTKQRRLIWQNRIYDITVASVIGTRQGVELITIDAKKRAA